MATVVSNGNRAFAQPGIDGGTFNAGQPASAVQIVARTFRVETAWVNAIQSSGVTTSLGTQTTTPAFSIYNTVQSAGLSIPSSQVSAGVSYAWGTLGLGG